MSKLFITLLVAAIGGMAQAASTVPAIQTIQTSHQHPQIFSGMEIQLSGNHVTVMPGVCRIGVNTVKVSRAAFDIAAPGAVEVTDEQYVLADDRPVKWMGGTHLKGCIAGGGTALPGVLDPQSVVVKLTDGTTLAAQKDYTLDAEWAGLSRVDGGRIAKGAKVVISYRVANARLDTIAVDLAGKVSLLAGKEDLTTPLPPAVDAKLLRIANLYMPANATTVKPPQVFVIGDGMVEPDDAETMIRSGLVSKTLRKLRGGQPVTIVAWGDSVTAGGEASSPERAFPQLFVAKLKERFKNASIALVNAGIGATNTTMRLPGIQKDVIAHTPDLVLIEFVNDMPLPEATVRSNLENAFEQIRAAGGEIVLITPHFVMPEMMGHEASLAGPRAKESRKNVEVLRAIASEQSVALADASKRWEHLAKEGLPYVTLLRNGINHPDDRGHELFVRELLTFFPVEQP